ncbi:MAG TPA: hypothetical protein VMZ30_17365, partial [Pyrinomonadaceae bacterium]|nr:hypothetical protein [Pyrinomonadaceae bacterium]
ETICVPGYTKEVRPASSTTNGVKELMLERAGLDSEDSSDYTLDHIIPLAIGGTQVLNALDAAAPAS